MIKPELYPTFNRYCSACCPDEDGDIGARTCPSARECHELWLIERARERGPAMPIEWLRFRELIPKTYSEPWDNESELSKIPKR